MDDQYTERPTRKEHLTKWFPYHSHIVAFTKANGTVHLDVTPKLWISFPKFESYRIQLGYVVFSANNGVPTSVGSYTQTLVVASKAMERTTILFGITS